jgi:hypothetical protein
MVVARHPLDMAVSLYHHAGNINRERVHQLTGQSSSGDDAPRRRDLREWLLTWVEWTGSRTEHMDSLPGVMWHLSDAWTRRAQSNVRLVHYADLCADLEAEMRRLARYLRIDVKDERWPGLVDAAGFAHMQARAAQLIDPFGVLKDPTKFFRRGVPGAGHEVLTVDELNRYERRARELAPPDLLRWLHRTTVGS